MTQYLLPETVLQTYLAIRMHFTSKSYDYFKYAGKLSGDMSKMLVKRNDKAFFQRLARKFQAGQEEMMEDMIVSIFHRNTKAHISVISPDDYKIWNARLNSLSYTYPNDLKKVLNATPQIDPEMILKLMIIGEIQIESFIILDDMLDRALSKAYDATQEHLPLWALEWRLRIERYRPFFYRAMMRLYAGSFDFSAITHAICTEFAEEKGIDLNSATG
jgi:hypothetical protein